ncbi:MAG: replication endonuclease [Chromatiales bacterium]|nr:replication endonuclease [Chromatiales bacterium]
MEAATLDGVWSRGFGSRMARMRAIGGLPDEVAGIVAAEYVRRAGPAPVARPYPLPDDRPPHERARAPRAWNSWLAAGLWLQQTAGALRRARVPFAFDEWELAERARQAAEICAGHLRELDRCRPFAEGIGITVPELGRGVTASGLLRRLYSAAWWHRRLRAAWCMAAESGLREAGQVHRAASPYASRPTIERRQGQKRRGARFLAERVATCIDTGEQLELWEIAKRSIANPAVRRAEFMTRLKGFELVAADCGHVANFYTITTPSRFHARHVDGRPNENHDGSTPRDGQLYLRELWARIRAKLKRMAVVVYGFRIAEPHHDGTPHWHLILWAPASQADTVTAVMRAHALADTPEEPGAARHRFKVERIDPARGSACSYVAKYVAKNIDGHRVGGDFEAGGLAADTVTAVDAWAATYRVRQFQQIGGPPVGLWRELRRVREPHECEPIERARSCADAGDWRGFVLALGGVEQCRRSPLVLEKAADGLNQWGEPAAPRAVGVRFGVLVIHTREKVWVIALRGQTGNLGPVEITVRGGRQAAAWNPAGQAAGAAVEPSPRGPPDG